MDDVFIYLAGIKEDLANLFAKYDNGEDVEEALKKLKPIIKLYYETQQEPPVLPTEDK